MIMRCAKRNGIHNKQTKNEKRSGKISLIMILSCWQYRCNFYLIYPYIMYMNGFTLAKDNMH